MTTRWKKRSSTVYDSQQKIQELEALLAQKDAIIADLEKKLDVQLQVAKKLRRDREELRNKNANLSGKLAEAGRKHSIANIGNGSTPPTHSRSIQRSSTSRLPLLPPTPGTPNSSQKSTPPGSLTPDTPRFSAKNPPQPSMENDSDTDYSDIEEPEEKSGKANSDKVDSELEAVLKAVGKSEWGKQQQPVKPVSVSNDKKWQPSPPVLPRQRNSSSASSTSSSASSGSSGKSGSYQVSKQSHSDSPPTKRTVQKIQSSESLASTLRQLMPKRPSIDATNEDVGPPARVIPDKEASVGVVSAAGRKPEAQVKSMNSSEKKAVENKPINKAKKKATFSETSDIIPVENSVDHRRGDSSSSDVQSSELESSFEVFSPTLTASPVHKTPGTLRGALMSLPNLDEDTVLGSTVAVRIPINKENRKSFLDDSSLQMEAEDQLNELESCAASKVRSRTQTLSALTGGKRRMELGRKMVRQHRLDMKRCSSISAASMLTGDQEPAPRDRASTIHEYELLSPHLAAKIKNMTVKRIYSTYGGKDVVNKAVGVIAGAYQTYKLRQRFLERRNEKRENRTLQRKRAQSLRQPNRRPSIMDKNRQRYKRRQDPIMKSTKTAEMLAKERVPHAHSGSRQQLVEKRRSETSLRASEERDVLSEEREEEAEEVEEMVRVEKTVKVEGASSAGKKKLISTISTSDIDVNFGSFDVAEENTEITQSFIFTLTNEQGLQNGSLQTEVVQDKPDGLPGSGSAQSLNLAARPLSIFSTASMESSTGEYSMKDSSSVVKSRTLPHPSKVNREEMKKEADLQATKLKTGVHYFNKKPVKGIQYLIKNSLLEDDPRSVADFFIHQKGLSKEKIGEFLGEINSEFNMAVLEFLVERSNMGDKPIDEALREFQQLFRMPGEAQKIDKIMEVFALEYYKHNKEMGPFKSEDSAYILSFAIMMLHTSLHNPSVKSRTSKKQWLSMNRGNNDGENFPSKYLEEVFDRIQATEFATGVDHTNQVAEIEKQISGLPIQKLSVPHRFLVLKMSAFEVQELGVKQGFRSRHRRTLFFFSDIVVICKRKHSNEYLFRDSFSLLNVLPVKFESHHYKYGVQLHAVDRDVPYQFNCDSTSNREQLLHSLDTITQHLKLLETERITTLGTTLVAGRPDNVTTSNLVCDAGDLISSHPVASAPPTNHREDFVPGVGDLVTSSLPVNYLPAHTENRISRDSGFVSQQLTPTPPQSPSLSEQNHASPTPDVTPTISPASSINTLTPSTTSSLPASRSSETLKQLQVASPNRSPSMDFLRRRKSTPGSSANNVSPQLDSDGGKAKKKERGSSEKQTRKGLFSGFNKSKVKDSSDGGKSKVKNLAGKDTGSPQTHRKLVQKFDKSIEDDSSYEASLTLVTS